MQIELRKELKGEIINTQVEKGTTIEELYQSMKDELKYTVLAAKVNNKFEPLTYMINEPCLIELLDMRTQAANIIYQNSLSLIFLKAVRDVLGSVEVDIKNALNKGVYVEVKSKAMLTAKEAKGIERRMRQIVDLDLPISVEYVEREKAFEIFKELGCEEKCEIIKPTQKSKKIPFYTLDQYKDFFYSLMVPSTGYIEFFQVLKYRRGLLIRFPHPSVPNKIPEYVDEKVLYKTFGEQKKWGNLLEIDYATDLNNQIRSGNAKEIIQLSEALHEQRIVEIAQAIKKSKKRIILIAGPSSSGKTTFAQRLCIQLKVNGLKPLYLGTDDYFVEREDTPIDQYGEKNYEDLEAVDLKLFNQNMNDLLDGKEVDLPVFDFIEGKKIFGKRITSIKSNQILVIEGIHALNEKLTEEIAREEKFKIYISPLTQISIDSHNRVFTTDHRMLRRMVRDYKYRGKSAKTTLLDWPKVRAGEDKNIFPFSNEADAMFNSVHLYEISVLKKYAKPLLEEIKPDEEVYGDAIRLLNFLSFFETIEDDSIISNNSILREFIGGSIFVE